MLPSVGSYSRRAARPSLYDTLRRQRLLSSLRLCLDAGDRLSFEGGADMWRDRSGGGYDFFLGSGTGADAADPTHNGVAGRRTKDEYFSFDGGDYLTLGQANPAWVDSLHKDSAKLTIGAWLYSSNIVTGVTEGIFGTSGASGFTFGVAFLVGQAADGDIGFAMQDGNNAATDSVGTTSARLTSGAFSFVAMSLDEAASSLILQINGTQETKTYAYATPSASAASFTAQIGTVGNAASAFKSGFRLASLAAWDAALSAAQLTGLFNATKGKYGVS